MVLTSDVWELGHRADKECLPIADASVQAGRVRAGATRDHHDRGAGAHGAGIHASDDRAAWNDRR